MYFYISCILQTPKVHKNVFQRSFVGSLRPYWIYLCKCWSAEQLKLKWLCQVFFCFTYTSEISPCYSVCLPNATFVPPWKIKCCK